jgi:hypothetical protein
MMRSPIRLAGTPSPMAAMRPTVSAPWMRGKVSVGAPRRHDDTAFGSCSVPYAPSRTQTSVLFMPQAETSMRTSPGPGFGTGTSLR